MSTGRGGSWLRGLTGLLAGGLIVLTLALAVGYFLAERAGTVGPGPGTLVWHGLAAVAALVAQLYADRHADLRGTLAAFGVAVITAAVLAGQWLA